MLTATAEIKMPADGKKPGKAKGKGRFEFKAPKSWLERATKVANGLEMGLSAYIRMVVTEDMQRREQDHGREKS